MAPVEQLLIYKGLLKPFQEKKPMVSKASQAQSMPDTPSAPIPKKLGTKTDYVPPWWKGEKGAYENAKKAMSGINNLPKMK